MWEEKGDIITEVDMQYVVVLFKRRSADHLTENIYKLRFVSIK